MYMINKLMKLNEPLYHTDELASLWGITNRNTLRVSISRYIKQGILYPVYRGLYASRPPNDVSAYRLGAAVAHGYCYVSTETVLVQAGVIFQDVSSITFVSEVSKKLTVGTSTFRFRRMRPELLYQPTGIANVHGVLWASPERAAADLLYFAQKYYFDAPKKLDWQKIRSIQKEVGYAR